MNGPRNWLVLLATGTGWGHAMAQGASFAAPAVHVLTEPDHLAVFMALGLFAGQQDGRTRLKALAAAAVVLLASVTTPLLVPQVAAFDAVEGVWSTSTLAIVGVLVAIRLALGVWLVLGVVSIVVAVHGLAIGLHFSDTGVASAVAGASLAALSVIALCSWLAARLDRGRGQIAVRVAGSWAAALGLMLLGLELRG